MGLQAVLERSIEATPAFAEVGATRATVLDGATLPEGWNHLRLDRVVGRGDAAFEAAAECVLAWGMHRGTGLGVLAERPRAELGSTVVVAIGLSRARLLAPCRVVWTVEEPRRRGFGYAALPGHPEEGEEAFLVSRDAEGAVTFTVVAFSRPARRLTRLAGPVVVLGQRLAAHGYARAVRRACAAAVRRAPA